VLVLDPVHQPLLHDLSRGAGPVIPERPLLKPWYRLAETDGRFVLEYAHKATVLEGEAASRLVPALLPLLDGTRTVTEIVACLGAAVEPAVSNALAVLGRHGLLCEPFPRESQPAAPLADTACFLASVSRRGTSPPQVGRALGRARVALAGDGPAAEGLARALRLSGVRDVARATLSDPPADVELALAVPSAAQLPELAAWNEAALARGTPWLPVLPFDGRFTAIGPLVVPGETCCYECYRLRRASNLGYWDEFWQLERAPAERPAAPAAVLAATGLAAVVAMRWLVERDPELPGVLFALELAGTPALTGHHVYRVPRCPTCSEAARIAAVLPWYERDDGV
jgi:bacteriocin biosynthesis cyclodehydratase domain-containing protein